MISESFAGDIWENWNFFPKRLGGRKCGVSERRI